MTRILLTANGAEKLRAELKRLKSIERPRVIAAIAEARAHGDLSENAEFDAAKDQQGFIEGRISELENQLSHAEVIDPARLNAAGRVVFGARVDLYDLDDDAEVSYQIVGELEADLGNGQISISSPIGRGLIGKHQGDEVNVETPGGTRTYKIVKVNCDPG
ncbi:MAG: Transcription elongation factor GreA [Gammaproteobacteria bacterium]|nr:Transcription elongation factor GreA [Gammaproteobacteria bacterium]